jgi:diguanylate cyclase (GGDEF)-like protein
MANDGSDNVFQRADVGHTHSLPDPVFILTRSGRYAALFGGSDPRYYHDGSSLVGKSMRDVLSDEKAAWFGRQIEQALATRTLQVLEYSLSGKDVKGLADDGPGYAMWFEGRVQALDFPVQGEDAVLWVASNITARNELEVTLRRQGECDALSGLFNRRKLMDVLADQFELYARYNTPTSVLIFDIDHFKRINDEFGHLNGDQAIVATADVCRRELRSTDLPARFGGDEFVALMPHTTREHAIPIAERLRTAIVDGLLGVGTLGGGATISGGLSEFLPSDATCEDVLKRADDALYQAKHEGRNRIVTRP